MRPRFRNGLLAVLVAILAAAVPEPDGYRLDDYRAPVPATVAGATVLDRSEVHALMERHGAVFIDVLPAPRRPPGMRPGTPWLPVTHRDIPGSLWWPDIGRGVLSPTVERALRQRLGEVGAAHPGMPLVFYCLRDCWMSWNAAKRAAAYGAQAAWFPDGTDGWHDAGYPMQDAEPEFLE